MCVAYRTSANRSQRRNLAIRYRQFFAEWLLLIYEYYMAWCDTRRLARDRQRVWIIWLMLGCWCDEMYQNRCPLFVWTPKSQIRTIHKSNSSNYFLFGLIGCLLAIGFVDFNAHYTHRWDLFFVLYLVDRRGFMVFIVYLFSKWWWISKHCNQTSISISVMAFNFKCVSLVLNRYPSILIWFPRPAYCLSHRTILPCVQ